MTEKKNYQIPRYMYLYMIQVYSYIVVFVLGVKSIYLGVSCNFYMFNFKA